MITLSNFIAFCSGGLTLLVALVLLEAMATGGVALQKYRVVKTPIGYVVQSYYFLYGWKFFREDSAHIWGGVFHEKETKATIYESPEDAEKVFDSVRTGGLVVIETDCGLCKSTSDVISNL